VSWLHSNRFRGFRGDPPKRTCGWRLLSGRTLVVPNSREKRKHDEVLAHHRGRRRLPGHCDSSGVREEKKGNLFRENARSFGESPDPRDSSTYSNFFATATGFACPTECPRPSTLRTLSRSSGTLCPSMPAPAPFLSPMPTPPTFSLVVARTEHVFHVPFHHELHQQEAGLSDQSAGPPLHGQHDLHRRQQQLDRFLVAETPTKCTPQILY